ncbi:hypothetical protein F4819DRAFT_491235 [Hypoxylon fuscum]|nr:hypothetical protein F4819DRAFT_491235 [Hypoxylon fuscum]
MAVRKSSSFLAVLAGLLAPTISSDFNAIQCPWFYLTEFAVDQVLDYPRVELVATCWAGSNTGPAYRTSRIDPDNCVNNWNTQLVPDEPAPPYPGAFSQSCLECGVAAGDFGNRSIHLRCSCKQIPLPQKFSATEINLDQAINVTDDGLLTCFGHLGQEVTTGLPFLGSATSVTSSTMSSTTSTTSDTPSTTTVNVISTVTNSCAAPSSVTVTKTKKKTKTHKVTETTKITVPVTVFTTPPPSLIISANLQTTVQASFTTMTANP